MTVKIVTDSLGDVPAEVAKELRITVIPVSFTRERSRAKAIDYLYNFVMSYSHIDELLVEDATTPDEAEALVERLSSKFPKGRIYRSKVNPVVGTHIGPHVLAVSVLGERE